MIPWDDTINMQNARKVLVKMFDHFDEESVPKVKEFLRSKALLGSESLLYAPVGDTGISQSYYESGNWTDDSKQRLSLSWNPQLVESLPNRAGVYSMQSTFSGKFCIGSTTDYTTRFINHYFRNRL